MEEKRGGHNSSSEHENFNPSKKAVNHTTNGIG
jgi:hypothetical protein